MQSPPCFPFTGCDYTTALNRKVKLRPLRLLEKDVEIQKVFAGMGNCEAVTKTQVDEIERFVCSLYGCKKLVSADYVRLDLFFQKYKPKPGKVVISCLKKMDKCSLPPCGRVLLENIKRTNYISSIWLNATSTSPPLFKPENCGWLLEYGFYRLEWRDVTNFC